MRVTGHDPGSGHYATCVIDVTTSDATYVSSAVIDIGHMVQLVKPRSKKNGATQTEERRIDAKDIARFEGNITDELMSDVSRHLCAYERRERISPRNVKGGPRGMVSAELASQLANAKELGGAAAAIARFLGYRVTPVTPEEWRKALCGDSHADEKKVKAAIITNIRGWPKSSNAHERDAAGVAWFAARRDMMTR